MNLDTPSFLMVYGGLGAIISEIPMIDKLDEDVYEQMKGKKIKIDGEKILI